MVHENAAGKFEVHALGAGWVVYDLDESGDAHFPCNFNTEVEAMKYLHRRNQDAVKRAVPTN